MLTSGSKFFQEENILIAWPLKKLLQDIFLFNNKLLLKESWIGNIQTLLQNYLTFKQKIKGSELFHPPQEKNPFK